MSSGSNSFCAAARVSTGSTSLPPMMPGARPRPRRRSDGEQRHDVAREAPQALPPARAAPRPSSIDQDVSRAGLAQLVELLRDVVGATVHGTGLVDDPGITGGPVGAAVNG